VGKPAVDLSFQATSPHLIEIVALPAPSSPHFNRKSQSPHHQWIIGDIRKAIKKFLHSNENEGRSCQNLYDTAKAVLMGKFIAMSTHVRKLERSHVNNLMIHL
jgi:hypothetical protein